MSQLIQIRRTETANNPPASLNVGELCVEMNDPLRLWVGVPVGLATGGKKLLAFGDAPADGFLYGRNNSVWQKISVTTLASGISFSPSGGLSSNNVQAALVELDTEKVNRAGDTMTGYLTLNANPVNPLHAVTKQYVDAMTGGGGPVNPADFVLKTGSTMTGALVLSANPTSPLQAATKAYVDSAVGTIGNFVLKTGDTMSGPLTVNNNITSTSVVASSAGAIQSYGYGGNAQAGLIWLGQSGSHYLYFDGTNYSMPNGGLFLGLLTPTNSYHAASKFYVDGEFYSAQSGYMKFPGRMMLTWNRVAYDGSWYMRVNFAAGFPGGGLSTVSAAVNANIADPNVAYVVETGAGDPNGILVGVRLITNGGGVGPAPPGTEFCVWCIGYY